MTDRLARSARLGRLSAVVALVAVNVVLVGLIAETRGIIDLVEEVGDDRAADPVDGDETGTAGDGTGDPAGDGDGSDPAAGEVPGDGDGAGGEGADEAAWPGGRGPVPTEPPVDRLVLLAADGSVTISGSAPSWAVASEVAELAADRVPGATATVDNQLTWHPDAPSTVRSGTVRLDPPLLYEPAQTTVPEASLAGLDLVADLLVANPTVFAVIVGYTDDLGETEENLAVAFARTANVVGYLVGLGVSEAQLVVAAPAPAAPAATNDSAEGRAMNRRVEVRLENLLASAAGVGVG